MIPTMFLFGLVLGRWWKASIPLAGIAWVVLVSASGIELTGSEMLGAAFLGAVNAAFGAVVYQVTARLVRAARSRTQPAGSRTS
jgi:hypothetical protein